MLPRLSTPHIALGCEVSDALDALRSLGHPIIQCNDQSLRVDAHSFSVAIYPEDGKVKSVWLDDQLGRDSVDGIDEKIKLYLARYGSLSHWELRMDNGWMRYWFNPTDHVAMVYGIHNDVIRFNQFNETIG